MPIKPRDQKERDLLKYMDNVRAQIESNLQTRRDLTDETKRLKRLLSQENPPPNVEPYQWNYWLKKSGLWIGKERA